MKLKTCSNCGNIIPKDSVFCQNCGCKINEEKEKFKLSSIKIIIPFAAISIIAIFLAIGSFVFGRIQIKKANKELADKEIELAQTTDDLAKKEEEIKEFQDKYDQLESDYDQLKKNLDKKTKQYNTIMTKYDNLKDDYDDLWDDYEEVEDKAWALDAYIVFVGEDQYYYHKYECSYFDSSTFWAYNIEAAKVKGYHACPYCID